MVVRRHRDAIRANLVRKVAVPSDAVRSHQHALHAPVAHQRGRHAVGYQRVGNAQRLELPCRQPRALQQRSRLVYVDVDVLPTLVRAPNHTKRRADPYGR